ncbi:HigA family addiction module antitoxin [Sphingomonas profundi]|uniref:HigA family addiction module antitoxin n=1 Tax=Alterirhizorhabdus profundi TaxID=2681549 RepID=UPI0012E703A2|nr:HigA family addiction module antitoxin [Sphingomonas profundi]
MAVRVHPSFRVHPGEWLRTEVVEANALSISRLADHLHVSRQALSALLNGRAGLSAEMALRFEQAFGLQADTLMRMQAAHDLADARAHAGAPRIEALTPA